MIKIKDERIEIEGSGEEIAKEFALIAAYLIESFEKKSGKLFTPDEILSAGVMLLTPDEILSAGVMLLEREVKDND